MDFNKIEKKLTSDGWELVRICGLHYQYKKSNVAKTAILPNHGSKDISIGVLKNLEQTTGLTLHS